MTSLVNVSQEASGTKCAAGGFRIDTGIDKNKDTVLDQSEIQNTVYICNGVNGVAGTNGTNGTNGANGTNGVDGLTSLITTSVQPSDNSCTGIKYKIEFVDSVFLGDFKTMYMSNANRLLFGVDIGVGMEAPITKTQRVMMELRFTWGHTYFGSKTSQNYNKIAWTDSNMQANEKVLSFTLAYMFDMDLRLNKTGRSTKDKETKRKPVRRRR